MYLSNSRTGQTYAIALLPSSSGTETEANEGGPCASLEQEDREHDAEGEAETGADEHRGKAAIPLISHISAIALFYGVLFLIHRKVEGGWYAKSCELPVCCH
jgi:hypothetical protein